MKPDSIWPEHFGQVIGCVITGKPNSWSDLYLTTSPIRAGVPDTPFYTGTHPPRGGLVVHKQTSEGVMFDHFVLPVQY